MSDTSLVLSYVTKGNASPRGKAKVYFSYAGEDLVYLQHTAELLFRTHDCAVYYYDYTKGAPDNRELALLLQEMVLFVTPVTANYLFTENNARCFELQFALQQHIPFLPLLQNDDLIGPFNEICGNLQFLNEFVNDATAISFEEKLKNYLDAVVLDRQLISRIQAAFDAYVFLSYRKKDRAEAQQLMRLIHNHPQCLDIAIWYDEFLVPGEPFDEAIEAALKKSNLFALLVTPNLVNEDNYVMQVEFPMARDAGKYILAAESIETDKDELRKKFSGLPDCVNAHDRNRIPAEIVRLLQRTARERSSTPEHNYLIGLAYLSGIDVERNPAMAVALITDAADHGLYEAMQKLANMYFEGIGTAHDLPMAIAWQKKTVSWLENAFQTAPQYGNTLFAAKNTLAEYCALNGQIADAEKLFLENVAFAERSGLQTPSGNARNKLAVYSKLGLMYHRQKNDADAKKYFEKAIETAQAYAAADPANRNIELANTYNNLGLLLKEMHSAEAGAYFTKAIGLIEPLAQRDPDRYWGTLSALYSNVSVFYNQRGDAAAETYGKKAVDLARKLAQQDPEQYGMNLGINLNNLGLYYSDQKDSDRATAYFLESIQVLEPLAQKNPERYQPELAKIYANVGAVYNRQGKWREASQYYGKALETNKQLAAKNPAAFSASLAGNFNSLGLVYYHQKVSDSAIALYKEALRLYEPLAQKHPERYQNDLAIVYTNIALTYDSQGKWKESAQYYEKAIVINKQLAEKDPAAFSVSLAQTYNNLGFLYHHQKDTKKAERAYLDAVSIMEPLAAKNPDRYQATLAASYQNLGMLYNEKRKNYGDEDFYRRTVQINERLASLDRAQYGPTLANSYNSMGLYYLYRKKKKTAQEFFEKAVALMEEFEKTNPERYKYGLAIYRMNLCLMLVKRWRLGAAKKHIFSSLSVMEEAAQMNPGTHMINLGNVYMVMAHYYIRQLRVITAYYYVFKSIAAKSRAKKGKAK